MVFPQVKRVQADLDNRRHLAVEYEAANKLVVEQNDELLRQVDYMKTELAKALSRKEIAISGQSGLSANVEHYQSQSKIIQAQFDNLKDEHDKLDVENYLLKVENDNLTQLVVSLKHQINTKTSAASRSSRAKKTPKQSKNT